MTKTDQSKERLRQHLTHLNRIGWIDQYQIIRDKVYYYKEVISYLKHLGFINETGHLIHEFYPDTIINNIHQFKQKEPRQISPRRAKAIGSKMVKRTLQDAIDQNTYVDRATFDDNELVFDYKPQKITLTDEQLVKELRERGYKVECVKII